MPAADKSRNTAQRVKGKVKEATGAATGNDRLRRKGKTDQTKANAKQTGEKLKDTLRP